MITIPLYLEIAQWALLGALGVLVVVMFRQLGRLTTGSQRDQLGPAEGSRAAALTYARLGDESITQLTPGDGQPVLLAFVDPTCPSCEELVGVLETMRATAGLDGLRTLLLISDPPSYLQISEVFRSTKLEIGRPARRDGLDSYQVTATPLLVAVDAQGMVRAAGSVVRPDQVQAFARSCLLPARRAVLDVVPAAQRSSRP